MVNGRDQGGRIPTAGAQAYGEACIHAGQNRSARGGCSLPHQANGGPARRETTDQDQGNCAAWDHASSPPKSAPFEEKVPLLERLRSDYRLRMLPIAARGLWVEIGAALQASGARSIRFCGRPVDVAGLACLVVMPEPETADALTLLIEAGLVWRDADGALTIDVYMPAQAAPDVRDRSEINRRNAALGWEKRRARRVQGQREMPMFGVVGGGDEASQACSDANHANRIFASDPKLKRESNLSKPAKQLADDSQYVRITRVLNEAAGLKADRTQDYGFVRSLLQQGIQEQLMLNAVMASTRPGVPHLGYFRPAILEAVEVLETYGSAVLRDWQEARVDWADAGRSGPPPSAPSLEAARMIPVYPSSAPRQLTAIEARAWEIAAHDWLRNGCVGLMPTAAEFRAVQHEGVSLAMIAPSAA